eukprot:gene4259-5618_t
MKCCSLPAHPPPLQHSSPFGCPPGRLLAVRQTHRTGTQRGPHNAQGRTDFEQAACGTATGMHKALMPCQTSHGARSPPAYTTIPCMKLLLVDDHPLFCVGFAHALAQALPTAQVLTAPTLDAGLQVAG